MRCGNWFVLALYALPNTAGSRSPAESAGATLAPRVVCLANHAGVVVGVAAFLGSLCHLKLVPAKWRPLVPPTSTPEGA
jgi:hypothetical protein